MDAMMKIAIVIILTWASLGTIVFIISTIVKTKRNISKTRSSRRVSLLHDLMKAGIEHKYKESEHPAIVVPDDDCVASNNISTITIADMKTGKLYFLDRRSALSGQDILEVCKPNSKIYDLPGDLFVVEDNMVDMEKLYKGAE